MIDLPGIPFFLGVGPEAVHVGVEEDQDEGEEQVEY